MIFTISNIYADCTFKITNNFYQNIKLKVGFFGYESKVINAEKSDTSVILIKDNQLNCISQTKAGIGIPYGELFDSKAKGKWIYKPDTQMIVALGTGLNTNDNYTYGYLDNKQDIVLMNNYKVSPDYFNIVINPVININYRTGSYH